jgi:hypothetical protein
LVSRLKRYIRTQTRKEKRMKTYFKISALALLIVVGMSSCLDEKYDEVRFQGAWTLHHYYENGDDRTVSYKTDHRDHVIYVEPDHSFSEGWLENGAALAVNGTWNFDEDRDEITLKDEVNGTRTYHLKYTFFLSHKSNGNEWIFKKL